MRDDCRNSPLCRKQRQAETPPALDMPFFNCYIKQGQKALERTFCPSLSIIYLQTFSHSLVFILLQC